MDSKGLFGNPHVGWSPRPLKNGQPQACYGQCNLNIGARKVGAALRRYPQIFMGPKSKEQILQKWDPVSKRLVNIHQHETIVPPERTHVVIDDINLNYPSDEGDAVFFTYRLVSDKNDTVNVALYRSNGTLIATADPRSIVAGTTVDGIDINYTDGDVGTSVYIVATPTSGDPVVSGMLLIVTLGGPVYRLVNTPFSGFGNVTVDSQNNIYYLFHDRIEKRTNTGELILSINYSGEAYGLTIDALQNIYIYGGTFLKKYDAVGAPIYSKSGINLYAITDNSLNVYTYSFVTGSSPVKKYSSTGTLLATFNDIIPSATAGFGTVAVDSAQNIYVVNTTNFTIKKYSSTGVLQGNVDLPPTVRIFIDNNDNFYLDTVFGNFTKYSPSFVELGTVFLREDERLENRPTVSPNGEFVLVLDEINRRINTYRLI